MTHKPFNIGIIVFDGVEPADFVNPMTVFEKANDYIEAKNTIRLVSKDGSPVTASNGAIVGPATSFDQSPESNILIVPGGEGIFRAITDQRITGFIEKGYADKKLNHILSVCSGSYLLAQAGILSGKEATVTARLKDDFTRRYPDIKVVDRSPVIIDNGRIVTSGQIFKGIEAAYQLVGMLYGNVVTQKVRERLGL